MNPYVVIWLADARKCLRRDLNPSRSRERAASLTGLDYRSLMRQFLAPVLNLTGEDLDPSKSRGREISEII